MEFAKLSTIHGILTFMRYLLLIVAVSSLGFAADNPEVMKIYTEMKAKQAEIEVEAAVKMSEYAKRTFIRVEVPVLPKDPKKSELDRYNLATNHNGFIDHLEAIAKSPEKYGTMERLMEALLRTNPNTPAMAQMGIKPAAQGSEKVASLEAAPKAKEKKKITAVLADGTKVE